MGSQQTLGPTPSLITIPPNYPQEPTPGKIEVLWNANYHTFYHRLSPYADYNMSLIPGFTKEPYYYTYIDESKQGLAALRRYDSRLFPIGSAPIDIVRVTKFLGSGRGIMFLGKQFLLQTANPFNETRIYNPTSPIVAAGMGLALGAIRPQRFIDLSGGLGGIATSLLGSVGTAIFGAPKTNPPPGTASDALSDPMKPIGGKGLIRAGTAERAKSHFEAAWQSSSRPKFSIGGLVKSLFQNFIPQTQPGIIHRSDEGGYKLMISAASTKLKYVNAKGVEIPYSPAWIAGERSYNKAPIQNSVRSYVDVNGVTVDFEPQWVAGKSTYVGYPNPQIMLTYSDYVKPENQYETKKTKKDDVESSNRGLKEILEKIAVVSDGAYTVNVPSDATVIRSGNYPSNGYDRLFAATPEQARERRVSAMDYPLGVLKDYRDYQGVVDNTVAGRSNISSKGFSAAGHPDILNKLTVLDGAGSKYDQGEFSVNALTLDKDGNRVTSGIPRKFTWQPYYDDQIALFFYDVVNDKYIPFRAAIKGVSEALNASWEELQFIGRGDKVYSYGGFNRSLNLGLSVVISSITELMPTWQRINYLTTLLKPANYTTSTFAGAMNRFMVPPMVMLTMGDMYKDQPVLIQSVVVTVPDDAAWETQNEFNTAEWEYLVNYIKSPNVLYGQLPREVDITLTLLLLEKERAVVGGANFGHAPRNETWSDWNTNTVPGGQSPNKMHKALVVNVIKQAVEPPPPKAPEVSAPSSAVASTIPQYEPETPAITPAPAPFRLLSTEPNITVPSGISNVKTNNVAPIFPKDGYPEIPHYEPEFPTPPVESLASQPFSRPIPL